MQSSRGLSCYLPLPNRDLCSPDTHSALCQKQHATPSPDIPHSEQKPTTHKIMQTHSYRGKAPDTRLHTSDANIQNMFGLWDLKTNTCLMCIFSSRCCTWDLCTVAILQRGESLCLLQCVLHTLTGGRGQRLNRPRGVGQMLRQLSEAAALSVHNCVRARVCVCLGGVKTVTSSP